MAVSREEAEEYELAGVGDDGRGQASSSRLSDHDYEGSEGEHARLLEHDGKLRLSEEVDGFLRSAHDDEPAVGKSSKVEELIARVS